MDNSRESVVLGWLPVELCVDFRRVVTSNECTTNFCDLCQDDCSAQYLNHLQSCFPDIRKWLELFDVIGRGGGIRTRDPLCPRQVRYQAALRPDVFNISIIQHLGLLHPADKNWLEFLVAHLSWMIHSHHTALVDKHKCWRGTGTVSAEVFFVHWHWYRP